MAGSDVGGELDSLVTDALGVAVLVAVLVAVVVVAVGEAVVAVTVAVSVRVVGAVLGSAAADDVSSSWLAEAVGSGVEAPVRDSSADAVIDRVGGVTDRVGAVIDRVGGVIDRVAPGSELSASPGVPSPSPPHPVRATAGITASTAVSAVDQRRVDAPRRLVSMAEASPVAGPVASAGAGEDGRRARSARRARAAWSGRVIPVG